MYQPQHAHHTYKYLVCIQVWLQLTLTVVATATTISDNHNNYIFTVATVTAFVAKSQQIYMLKLLYYCSNCFSCCLATFDHIDSCCRLFHLFPFAGEFQPCECCHVHVVHCECHVQAEIVLIGSAQADGSKQQTTTHESQQQTSTANTAQSFVLVFV